ncbi:MAG TPA: D-glycerate dehydrogenase [Magnetospirillaceae bacterium]|nr:D-glycerate dehydrogenase [Magnetospirillaceae bacterium]
MNKPRLVVAPGLPRAVFDSLSERFDAIGGDGNMSVEEALAQVEQHRADALLVSHRHKMTAEAIARLPAPVKVLATVTVGYDHIDVPAAKAKGLIVTNTPDVLTDCTADMAMLLMLAACRRAAEAEQLMRQGWRKSFGMGEFLGLQVTGKRLGIFGMGRIGQAMAQRARGFNMQILYSNRSRLKPELEAGARYFADLREMLPHCDILAIHAPATPETDKVIDAEVLALLPKGAVLVNTARGSLIDEEALLAALRSGHLFAAGLDVFRSEPDFDRRFAELPNVFLTPHIGSATIETRNAMGFRALDNIAAVCSGAHAIDPV